MKCSGTTVATVLREQAETPLEAATQSSKKTKSITLAAEDSPMIAKEEFDKKEKAGMGTKIMGGAKGEAHRIQ